MVRCGGMGPLCTATLPKKDMNPKNPPSQKRKQKSKRGSRQQQNEEQIQRMKGKGRVLFPANEEQKQDH